MINLKVYRELGEYVGRRFKEVNQNSLIDVVVKVFPLLRNRELGVDSLSNLVSDINCGRGYKFLPHDIGMRRSEEFKDELWRKRIERLPIILQEAGFEEGDKLHQALSCAYDTYVYPPVETREIERLRKRQVKQDIIKSKPQEMVFRSVGNGD